MEASGGDCFVGKREFGATKVDCNREAQATDARAEGKGPKGTAKEEQCVLQPIFQCDEKVPE